MTKRALICGISGQDGAYLAQLLLAKGYEVFGTSRDAEVGSFSRLKALGIERDVELRSMTLTDFRSVLQILSDLKPDEIYNLAGQTSVGLSFAQPVETFESVTFGTLNLLEVMRYLDTGARLYQASSGECYGETTENAPAREGSAFHPRSPYGVAKAAAYWTVVNYREAYGLHACSGILFNHESPLRPERFVTRKIVRAAAEIARGERKTLELGNLDIVRDWGWAPEYVEAMWLMLQHDKAEDFLIATGQSNSLEDFTRKVFESHGLDWREHVVSNADLLRASDIATSYADPSKADRVLGWKSRTDFDGMITRLVDAEREGRCM